MSEVVDGPQAEIDESKEKQQNDLLARREARRRKILENAKSRLERLSGAEKSESSINKCSSHTEEFYPDPEIRHPEFVNLNSYSSTYTTTTPNHLDDDLSTSPLFDTPVVTPPTKFEKFLQSRVHIVLLSIITYMLHYTRLLPIFARSSFVLFLTIECLELVFFRQEKPLNPIVNLVLMLSGLNTSKAGALIKLVGLLNRMLSDLALFVFSFVVCHAIYGLFNITVAKAFNTF